MLYLQEKNNSQTEHFSSETKWGTQEVAHCFSMKSTADYLYLFLYVVLFLPFFLNFGMSGIWELNVRYSHKNDTGCELLSSREEF